MRTTLALGLQGYIYRGEGIGNTLPVLVLDLTTDFFLMDSNPGNSRYRRSPPDW